MGSNAKDTKGGNHTNIRGEKTKKMLVTFKTLDHKIFKLDVETNETVSDLKSRLEDDMGRENLYKLIYSGKILKDENLVSSYNINAKHFVVLMITKTKTAVAAPKESIAVHQRNVTELEPRPSTSSVMLSHEIKGEDKAVQEKKKEHVEEVKEVDSCLELENHQINEDIEQESTVVGLDWIEQQIKEKESHFITEREFSIALDVVMSTEYLADDENYLKTVEGITLFIEKYFTDNDELPEVENIIKAKTNDIFTANPNLKQLDAFLSDICGIHSQSRRRMGCDIIVSKSAEEEEEEDVEVEEEHVVSAFDRNVDNIVAMGFIREEIEVALRAAFNNPDQAVEYLISGIPPSAFAPDNNPLAFLRNNEEFQHIRYLVQSNPAMLQSLLLSFGQKHPDLMDSINKNKGTFVRMLHEPDGAKGFGDDQSIVVDSINSQGNEESHER